MKSKYHIIARFSNWRMYSPSSVSGGYKTVFGTSLWSTQFITRFGKPKYFNKNRPAPTQLEEKRRRTLGKQSIP